MRRIAYPFVLLALAGLTYGCGSGGEDSTERGSQAGGTDSARETYIARADAICSEVSEPYESLLAEGQSALARGDLEGYVRSFEAHLRNLEGGLKRLRRLPRPPGDSGELYEVFDLLQGAVDAGFGTTTSIKRDGLNANLAEGRVVESLGDATREAAEDYGFEICGQAPLSE